MCKTKQNKKKQQKNTKKAKMMPWKPLELG